MLIGLPEDMPTFSLGDAQSVGVFANGYHGAIIGALLIEAKVTASGTQLRSLIDQGEVELVRGENSDAALGDVFSYSPKKVINHYNHIDALFPGDVIRAGTLFVRLVE
ncbi:MAG: hypothetical protein OXI91_16740 [Chloroflexota bacterium]|nr:hypothetical protein [Chloroflexota bacterium]